ncbi:MAG: bifunctional UDP-N-acetylglucosamine diphosphorylase/glucosamine-1-phosphate N-acetyltransferase GlmU [Clostridia bacterium]|nr:bifunctional UDP-N-acetylglucosamine diphosphorylase/glucosamine-1-phosphate N-acetyltransferase GlmU [Clostridia bacterium]
MKRLALILASGDGKRMKSDLPKVMHRVCGIPLVGHVFRAVEAVSDDKPIVITGRRGELMRDYFGDRARYAEQAERRGTAHAVMCGQRFLEGEEGLVTVTAGDMPLIRLETFQKLAETTEREGYAACVLTAIVDDATGYGRILRDENGGVSGIVEHRDATEEQKQIQEINTSIYCFRIPDLLSALTKVNDQNAQGELYLTDTLAILRAEGKKVGACVADDVTEAMGINDRVQLAQAEKAMRARINERVMREGVTLIDPDNTYIEPDVEIGKDTVIYPNNLLTGQTKIGERCVLYPNSRIDSSVIGDETEVQASVMLKAIVGTNCTIGPNAYLRPGSRIGNHARIGDFVEIKNSEIGDGTKVSHLTYIGDAQVGKDCNMGCGTVFVNYDGKEKHKIVVGDHVFIGCNANLIAPVTIGDNALIAAGTTVTEDVGEDDMAIARSRQTTKKGWVKEYQNWKR